MTTIEPDATVPRRFTQAGDYDLIRKMGSGGFGVVFEARHRHTGLLYAVKRVDLSAEDAERYRNEALYPARIASQSLHVLGVHSFFHDPGEDVFYLVTELVPHGDLRNFLDSHPKPLPIAQALDVAIGIAKGLAAIHAQGIVHRELKPANVLMDRKDDRWVPKIADFGLARSTRSVSIGEFATSGYAAPEQMDLLSEHPLGPESDLFAFGMVLYELLTGEKATATRDLREYGRWVGSRRLPPAPSTVRAELAQWPQLDTLVAGLLEFDRTKRLNAAPDVVRTLTRVLRSVDTETGAEPAVPTATPSEPVVQARPASAPMPTPTPKSTPPVAEVAAPASEAIGATWNRRRMLTLMGVAFMVTGAAMIYGLPYVETGKFSGPAFPQVLLEARGKPLLKGTSWAVLPALFGLAVASALGLNAARAAVIAVLSVVAYNLALYTLFLGFLGPRFLWLAILVAGGVGALAVRLSLVRWFRPTRRDLAATAAAGIFGAALFAVSSAAGVSRIPLVLCFVMWQVVVGLFIVDRTMFGAANAEKARTRVWRPWAVIAVGMVTILICGGSTWARSRPIPLQAGEYRENAKDHVNYAWIPPGEFQMGCSPDDSECAQDEQPQHKVTFTKGFWIRRSEVSVKDWKALPGSPALPPAALWSGLVYNKDWADESMPIVNVTWQQARDYCAAVDGRLPTEAEWEYAARAGTSGARYGRLKEIAFYSENANRKEWSSSQMSDQELQDALVANLNIMQHTGGKSSNAWVLDDMLGNVAEWVEDDYGETSYSLVSGGASDPPAHLSGVARVPKVVRGGSWGSRAREVRASARGTQAPDAGSVFVGFRCVWNAPATRQ
jgi:formylglycine-generating enzyme required for sulfatase activity/tRNA A-37 threonylcarbamoyl transferase component Bud32